MNNTSEAVFPTKGSIGLIILIIIFIGIAGIVAVFLFWGKEQKLSLNSQRINNYPSPTPAFQTQTMISTPKALTTTLPPTSTQTNLNNVYILNVTDDVDDEEGILLDKAARLFYAQYPDDYDFLIFFPGFKPKKDLTITAQHVRVQNDVWGICVAIEQPDVEKWGSRKIKGISSFPYGNSEFKEWIDNPNASGGLLLHETGHQWLTKFGQSVQTNPDGQLPKGINRSCEGTDFPLQYNSNDWGHWSKGLQMPVGSKGIMIGGIPWVDNKNGTYSYDVRVMEKLGKFHPFDLYLMGLMDPSEITATYFLLSDVAGLEMPRPPALGVQSGLITISSKSQKITINDIIRFAGEPRNPDVQHSQKDFSIAFVIFKKPGQTLSDTIVKAINQAAQAFPQQWAYATDNRSSMNVK